MVNNMKITVIHPFSLRLASDKPVREFPAGVHDITEEEHGHWFLKACLKEGRALPLADEAGDEGGELVAPTKAQLMELKATELKTLLEQAGGTVPPGNPSKDVLSDLLLAGQEGVTLVKGPDGIYVRLAE
ncbi:hypothetical protein KL86DPRO_10886 [uncultured delta proteobacterium]|uniref:Uncharacterized protein n=1 Tax=uncultured delta proteobacterium TaxID=34034 RepID=A0A212J7X2_9DELT|nr:hypothetical protein KL86DPRO_10886 [uncultured delta proteobacterium]